MFPHRTVTGVAAFCFVALAPFGSVVNAAGGAFADVTPTRLRCEYAVNPLGIDVRRPRLSWAVESSERGQRQRAYRVLVAESEAALAGNRGDLWDSSKVASDRSVHVLYGGRPLRSGMRVWWKVRLWDAAGTASAWSAPARWTMGPLEPADWKARWIGIAKPPRPPNRPASMLRRAFSMDAPIRRATVYATALGLYELHVNGRRVGEHVLAPEWTDYHTRVQYQTFDVTGLVREGENALGAVLADGWYSGRVGLTQIVPGGPLRGLYGQDPRLLVQLDIKLADGRTRTITSDAAWRATTNGPLRGACLLDGETYDARREIDGWTRPGFDDSRWQPARVYPRVEARLVSQCNEPIRSEWRVEGDRLTLEVDVPANTTATVWVPTGDPTTVREGDVAAQEAKGVALHTTERGAVAYRVASGRYRFTARRNEPR